MTRFKVLLAALVVGLGSLMLAPTPAQATTCGPGQSEVNRTTFNNDPDTAVYTDIRYRICTGNLGNQFVDLSHAYLGFDWEAGNYPCSGWGALESVTFDTKFWDDNDTWYDYGPITLPCVSSGQSVFTLQLGNAPDYRIDQNARWRDVIHVNRTHSLSHDVTHGGRYY